MKLQDMYTLDAVAEWFLRLNGFFTVVNFVIHPIEPNEASLQRTDADVVGVRFPYRQEIVSGRVPRNHEAGMAMLPTESSISRASMPSRRTQASLRSRVRSCSTRARTVARS